MVFDIFFVFVFLQKDDFRKVVYLLNEIELYVVVSIVFDWNGPI